MRSVIHARKVILVLALALASCAPLNRRAVPTAPPAVAGQVVATADAAFSAERALEHARWLAESIGIRSAGSAAEKAAAESLATRLQAMGYQVALQPFEIEQFDDHGSELTVESSSASPGVLALVNSISGTVKGPLVGAGLGRRADFTGIDVRGAIAVLERGEIPFAEKARNAADAGAVGALIYNNESGSFRGVIPGRSTIPVAALSAGDGQALLSRMSGRSLTAELTVKAAVIKGESRNVIADWPGPGERVIVLGAHYDSVPEGPGANDNASGTATVLELARVLAAQAQQQPLPFGIRVVFFGAEEIGLNGSEYYVSQLAADERAGIVAMLNFDMVGVGNRALVGGDDHLTDVAVEEAAELGARVAEMTGRESGGSDHASFLAAGIPALFFHRQPDPNYHTAEDQATYLNPEYLQAAAELAQSVVDHLAEQE